MATETTLEKPLLATGTTEIPASGTETAEPHPYRSHWASVVGAFQDDPMLDVMMANIRRHRLEIDADETIA